MNKKGFTLIELLSVVTLIVLISLIVIPNIASSINKKKGEISEANMQLLANATDVYIENHSAFYTNSFEANGSTYCIPVQTLINDGVLETPFKDVNGNEIDYSNVVKSTYNATYNGFQYEFVSKNDCTEIIQFVSKPELADNMIPVIYEDGSWKKADVNSKWYNYLNKNWANAVVVKETKDGDNSHSRYEYLEAPFGTVINDNDILGYFVWIPRFRYQLFSSNSVTPINIAFESVSTNKSMGTTNGQWLTHPAFTYNNHELSGIWVGKYEANNSNDSIIVKSGTAWTNIDYVSANDKILSMTNQNNIYGLKGVNTHMVRNSEWGALAYLTNSIYGNLSDNSSTGNNTGIYNLSGNKEFIIMDNENQYSLGYSLSETNNWSNDNSFPTSENLYLTRGGNSIFNYQNSKVIDPNTTFRVAIVNSDSSSQDYKRKYVVTFDPNGGSLDQTTKEVSYHDAYGELPVPTREGYTFMGWNGKNLFKKQGAITLPSSLGLSVNYDSSNNSFNINGTQDRQGNIVFSKGPLDIVPGTQITTTIFAVSGDAHLGSGTGITYAYSIFSQDNSRYIRSNESLSTFDPVCQFTKNMISDSGGTNTQFMLQLWRIGTVFDNYKIKIQIEEGDTSTEYEPYYITSATPVVQDKNHTLKAIWEANS